LRSKASLLIHRWPLQFSEGSATAALDKADLVQHVHVADCFKSLDAKAKRALLQFSGRVPSKYTALLHVKHDADGKRISGYYGAGENVSRSRRICRDDLQRIRGHVYKIHGVHRQPTRLSSRSTESVFCIRIYFEFRSPCRSACQISQCATRTPSMSLRLRVDSCT
jgi:hypothetical protein